MRARHAARVAAPAVFLLAATVAALVVRDALDRGQDDAARPVNVAARDDRRPARPATRRPAGAARRVRGKTYVIKRGDTLATVAAAHDTNVAELLELNPNVDPVSLTVGQRIRVP